MPVLQWLYYSFYLSSGIVPSTGGSLQSAGWYTSCKICGFIKVFPWQKMFPALAVHCSASISLSFFVFEKWECWTYWVIFALCRFVFLLVHIHFSNTVENVYHFCWFCCIRISSNNSVLTVFFFISVSFSVLPALVEILLFAAIFGLKKKPL